MLAGARLLFSRVIPLESDPRAHPLWRLAEQFGGACAEAPDERVTHVVAAQGGTEKVLWARRRGKFVVTPAWWVQERGGGCRGGARGEGAFWRAPHTAFRVAFFFFFAADGRTGRFGPPPNICPAQPPPPPLLQQRQQKRPPNRLECSCVLWRRADEARFACPP